MGRNNDLDFYISKKTIWLAVAAIIILAAIAYEPIRHNDFIKLDDPGYISENPNINKGFTIKSFLWAFEINGYQWNWHPITWISHMFDCHFFGLDPLYHHIHSVILHTASALILLWFLARTTKNFWASAFIAAVFALHPLRVESVAWASERKDVLCIFFFMLTLVSYSFYCQNKNVYRYLLTVLFYALGLMAKPTIVTLSFVLLLFDYWPLKRFVIPENYKTTDIKLVSRLLVEKIPFFVLAVISSALTFIAQHWGGIPKNALTPAFPTRLLNAFTSIIQYISKTFYPVDLAVLYPHPNQDISIIYGILCIIAVIGFSIFASFLISKKPFIFVGWFFFIGTLIPTIGLIQVGAQAYADRYSYIPSIGFYIFITFLILEYMKNITYKHILLSVCIIILLCLTVLTRNQVKIWKNSCTLYEHTCKATDNNFIMLTYLSQALLNNGKPQEALNNVDKALDIKPYFPEAINAKSRILLELKRDDEVIAFLNSYEPEAFDSETYIYWAVAHTHKDNIDRAIQLYHKSIELNPVNFIAMYNLGLLMDKKGDKENAIAYWHKSIDANPNFNMPHISLGNAYMEKKMFRQAIEHFEKSLQNTPSSLDTLAAAYAGNNNFHKAVETAQKALELATAQNQNDTAAEIKKHLELFKQQEYIVENNGNK